MLRGVYGISPRVEYAAAAMVVTYLAVSPRARSVLSVELDRAPRILPAERKTMYTMPASTTAPWAKTDRSSSAPLMTKKALTAAGDIVAQPQEVRERRARKLAVAPPKAFLQWVRSRRKNGQ